jgi:hypothetical protein
MPSGQVHDVWERAAQLMHERFAAQSTRSDEATKPWDELSDFYRGSNRRAVRNALRMVENIGGHTWDAFGGLPDPAMRADPADAGPLERLRAIGFDRDVAMAMAKAEHEDWYQYLHDNDWRHGAERSETDKRHPRMLKWHEIQTTPDRVDTALNSLADTLYSLRQLGYRSRPS